MGANWVFRLQAPFILGLLHENEEGKFDVVIPRHALPAIPRKELASSLNATLKDVMPLIVPGTLPLSRRVTLGDITRPAFLTVFSGGRRVGVINFLDVDYPCYAEVQYNRIDEEQPFRAYCRFDGERWRPVPLTEVGILPRLSYHLRAHGVMGSPTRHLQLCAEAAADRRRNRGMRAYSCGKSRKWKSLV